MKSKAKRRHPPAIPAALAAESRRAIELHQQGHLMEAESLYRRILTAMPMHFDSLHLLGVIKAQQNEFAAALPFFEQAVRVNPASASAFNNFGNVLHALGRYDQALASYDRSLALRADNAKALMHRGNTLRKLQRPDEALASYDRALRLRPDYAEALIHRGGALTEMGRYDEAVAAYRQALASGGDAPRIIYSLACLGAEAVPKASPMEYVKGLFDQYADAFDEHLVEALEYKTPTFLVDALRALMPPDTGSLDVVDLGCGTGLCGPLLRPLARTLVGVDLSPKMLAKAGERGGYDELVCAEVAAYLAGQPQRFDVGVAADVFVYIGDLSEVFTGMRKVLRPGGWFGFSVEAGDGTDFILRPSHRFAHSLDYLRRLAASEGFMIRSLESRVLRKNRGTDVPGHLVIMQREHQIDPECLDLV
jgi:predicted TPR repeat methyltransferase